MVKSDVQSIVDVWLSMGNTQTVAVDRPIPHFVQRLERRRGKREKGGVVWIDLILRKKDSQCDKSNI